MMVKPKSNSVKPVSRKVEVSSKTMTAPLTFGLDEHTNTAEVVLTFEAANGKKYMKDNRAKPFVVKNSISKYGEEGLNFSVYNGNYP